MRDNTAISLLANWLISQSANCLFTERQCRTLLIVKILVTGSSGTIGTRLCEKLLEQGHDVVGADWEPFKWIQAIEDLRIDVDLRDEDAFDRLPTDVDMIVHLAANARVYELVENPDRARDNIC